MNFQIQCDDFLADNPCVYAIKAKRKKITILRIQAINRGNSAATLQFGLSQLIASGRAFEAQQPDSIVRRLGEFTWDFLLYAIVDFHPITTVIDASLFLTGPLYNRRLRRKLAQLSADDVVVPAGESRSALLAFRGVPKGKDLERLTIPLRDAKDGESTIEYWFTRSPSDTRPT